MIPENLCSQWYREIKQGATFYEYNDQDALLKQKPNR